LPPDTAEGTRELRATALIPSGRLSPAAAGARTRTRDGALV